MATADEPGLTRRPRLAGAALASLVAAASCVPASWGARALLHPARRPPAASLPAPFERLAFAGKDVTLAGWRRRTPHARRGTIVYLHGIADGNGSGIGVAERFAARGFDVVAYDSRAHGASGGNACTYGFYEKHDLMRVVDAIDGGPVVLLGVSMGAAVAMQAAAIDPRIAAVVGAEIVSDLGTVARERAPFFYTHRDIARALTEAEREGQFSVADVSPQRAAALVRVPVLLVHGERDRETTPDHSRRVYAALPGSKRLIVVPDAAHNGSLTPATWIEIERWLDAAVRPADIGATATRQRWRAQKDVSPPTSRRSRRR